MGISMKAIMVTDGQILGLCESTSQLDKTVQALFRGHDDDCYLADYWDGIHYVLTAGNENSNLPLSALKRGDVEFSGDVAFSKRQPESTHAIYSTTVRDLAIALRQITESTLRERFNKPRMLELNIYPGRLWAFPDHEDDGFRELMLYYSRLRDLVAKAAGQNKGLFFIRYEDW